MGDGEIKKSLVIQAKSISKAAKEKVLKAGGKIEEVVKVKKEKEEKDISKAK